MIGIHSISQQAIFCVQDGQDFQQNGQDFQRILFLFIRVDISHLQDPQNLKLDFSCQSAAATRSPQCSLRTHERSLAMAIATLGPMCSVPPIRRLAASRPIRQVQYQQRAIPCRRQFVASTRRCTRTALRACVRSSANTFTSETHKAEKPLNIVFVSAEVGPWSKTGGLGDVVGGLPIALAQRGHTVMTIAPRFAHRCTVILSFVMAHHSAGLSAQVRPVRRCMGHKHHPRHRRTGGPILSHSEEWS